MGTNLGPRRAGEPRREMNAAPPRSFPAQGRFRDKAPFWTLMGVIVGFMLPLCACTFFASALLISVGGSGGDSSFSDEDAVAIVRVEGTITSSDDSSLTTGATSARVIADIDAAEADDTVKAIILRIDSPGGSVTGSAQIYERLLLVQKPLIVSMAGTAASGGYYVSAPATYIMARPDTITGSIGVIISIFNYDELIEEVGVEVYTITSGPSKDVGSPWNEFTEAERLLFQSIVDESYEEFVRIIVEGRGLDEAAVRELADGRVYTGRQALTLGLVDELGNFDAAVAKAAALGGITGEPRIIEYDHTPSFEDILLGFEARITTTESDVVLTTLDELATPLIEYRYLGPRSD